MLFLQPPGVREAGSAEVISEKERMLSQLQHLHVPVLSGQLDQGLCDEIWTAANDFLGPEIKPVWDVRIILYIISMIQERKRFHLCIAESNSGWTGQYDTEE